MKHNHRRSPGKPRVSPTVFDRLNPNVAGIDCGSAEHFVAVPPDRDPTPLQGYEPIDELAEVSHHYVRRQTGGRCGTATITPDASREVSSRGTSESNIGSSKKTPGVPGRSVSAGVAGVGKRSSSGDEKSR